MNKDDVFIWGEGMPLVVLPVSVVPDWRGAGNDWENSIAGGGVVESDYDAVCASLGADGFGVMTRHGCEILVLDGAFGGMTVPPETLSLDAAVIVLTQWYQGHDLPLVMPRLWERIVLGQPERSVPFHVQDTTLRFQVGAESGVDADHGLKYLDIPVTPGIKQCDLYRFEYDMRQDMVIVIGDRGRRDR